MTPQQLTAIALRMFSIWLAITSIPYLFVISNKLAEYENQSGMFTAIGIGGAYLLAAIIVWFFPLSIAHKLVPKTKFENRLNTRPDEVATIAISLLGLWKLTNALPDLVAFLFQASLNSPSDSIFSSLDARGKSDVFFYCLEIGIAIFFLVQAHTIAKLLLRSTLVNAEKNRET